MGAGSRRNLETLSVRKPKPCTDTAGGAVSLEGRSGAAGGRDKLPGTLAPGSARVPSASLLCPPLTGGECRLEVSGVQRGTGSVGECGGSEKRGKASGCLCEGAVVWEGRAALGEVASGAAMRGAAPYPTRGLPWTKPWVAQ